MKTHDAGRDALRLSVRGVVQGVGFRPFVHRLAVQHQLVGCVRNESGGVIIEIEGSRSSIETFLDDLRAKAPPLAQITSLDVERTAPTHASSFRIADSAEQVDQRQPVSPDVATCRACEAELCDPQNRRYRYPFITCTDCGPRYTVIESMPYDRQRTSMRAFAQCDECQSEYDNPRDRRYHSETNSCLTCGPRLWFARTAGGTAESRGAAALDDATQILRSGRVLALRGLGGFHLAVDATDEAAVSRLRRLKNREAKPLAVMVRSVDAARQIGVVGPAEESLLASRERPIVLLRRQPDAGLALSVSPGLDTVGVMTPYTPLHHLLLADADRPLVMTSGNASDEPIATGIQDASERLGSIADGFLLHDREIVARYDDSVVRIADGAPIFLRRARGYAPLPLTLPNASPTPLVAVGPHLKNTFTLVHEGTAYVSQHIGDLENLETLTHFQSSLDAFSRLFHIEPEVAVRDLHPGYLSTRVAEDLDLERTLSVQHHHAHIAAVAAEYGITRRVIGVAYDGTGFGDDGAVWGAEILVADLQRFERVGQLRYAPLPGGDLAVRRPWRAALGYLSLEPDCRDAFPEAFRDVSDTERRLAERQIERGLNAPRASSMGRLFDAAAAVLGVRRESHYEGQAAMELEALAGRRPSEPLPFPMVTLENRRHVMDPIPLLVALGERRAAGVSVGELAAQFHESVARTTVDLVDSVREATGIRDVALGGGVFQNVRLLSSVVAQLRGRGFRALIPRKLSPNDGAISYGQAAVAASLLKEGSSA